MTRRGLTRREFMGILGVGGAGLLAACAGPTAPTGAGAASAAPGTAAPATAAGPKVDPGKLTMLIGAFGTQKFDNAFVGGSGGEQHYGKLVHAALISSANGKVQMQPGIASKWDVSQDGTTWSFTIRDGVKFHNGSAVTMDDVVWTMRHSFGPGAHEWVTGTAQAAMSKSVASIDLGGPREVLVKFKTPQGGLDSLLFEGESQWFGVMPKRDKLSDKDAQAAYDRNPIGTGMFKVTRQVPGDRIELERFEEFYYQPKNGLADDRRAKFSRLDIVAVPEAAARVAALLSRQADIAAVSLKDKAQIEAAGGRIVFGQEGAFLDGALYGAQFPGNHFRDKRARIALNLAVDRVALRDRVLGGQQAFVIKGLDLVTPSTTGYTPELDPLGFDPEQAKQQLAAAGYPDGRGFGQVVFNIDPSDDIPGMIDAGQVVADQWRKVLSLDVKVVVGDSAALKARKNSGDLGMKGEVLWKTGSTRTDAADIALQYTDQTFPGRRIEDLELAAAVLAARKLVAPQARAAAFTDVYKRMRAQVPDLAIGYGNIAWGVGPRIATWEPLPLAGYVSAVHTITLK